MTQDELQAMIKTAVNDVVAPLTQVQRKYSNDGFSSPFSPAPINVKSTPPGITTARIAKLLCLAKNDHEKALNIATGGSNTSKGMYPDDQKLHTAIKALSAGGDGGYLIPDALSDETVPLLYAKTSVAPLGARQVPMPNGNLNMPKLISGSTATYMGEGDDAKKSQPKFGNIRLSSKKLVNLVPISNDLIRSSSYKSDEIILNDMLQQMALKFDSASLFGSGTEYTPRGISNTEGVTKLTVTSLIDGDYVGNLVGNLLGSNSAMISPGFIMNPATWTVLYNCKDAAGFYLYRAEMNNGTINSFPFRVSTQIPTGTDAHACSDIFFGDWSELMIAEQSAISVQMSEDASYIDENNNIVSAFSKDQVLIKTTSCHDIAARHPSVFSVYNFYTK